MSKVSLREYVESRFDSLEKAGIAQKEAVVVALAAQKEQVAAALAAADRAVAKAETAAERRFESVNEFRAQLADQANTFMPRSEFQAMYESLLDKIEAQSASMTRVHSRLDLTQGARAGLGQGWALLIGAVGLVAAVATVILALK